MNAAAQLFKRAGNQALQLNPVNSDINITTHGSDFLWAVFSVMALTGLGTMAWSLKMSRGERAFHYLSAAILATASVAYFSLASDLGSVPIRVEYTHYGPQQVNGQLPGLKSAAHLGDDFKKAYLYSSLVLTILWTLYPIAWGLADGGNVISPDGEMVFYGVLDLLAKPVFALFHLFSLRNCNYSSLHLKSGKFSDYEDVAANHFRTMENGKASEAGVVHNNTTTTGVEPAPAMRQTHVTQ